MNEDMNYIFLSYELFIIIGFTLLTTLELLNDVSINNINI